jgi:hypothetical protein
MTMGEARSRAMHNGGILEPKGKAPGILNKELTLQVGVARDALAVAIQVGDLLAHTDPAGAEEVAHALLMCAHQVRGLRAMRDGKILST